MADVGLIRKRLRAEIDATRRADSARRDRAAATADAYEAFLASTAVPIFRQLANALRAEGIAFDVLTPPGGVSLVSDRRRDEVIEMMLDTSVDPPEAMLVSVRSRGSRVSRSEAPVKPGADPHTISEDDLIERVIHELRPWLA
jgi:hypothetical protein